MTISESTARRGALKILALAMAPSGRLCLSTSRNMAFKYTARGSCKRPDTNERSLATPIGIELQIHPRAGRVQIDDNMMKCVP